MLSQFEHAVLNNVQGGILVADVEKAALECTLFDAFEEFGQFLFSGQKKQTRNRVVSEAELKEQEIMTLDDVFWRTAMQGLVAVR